MEKSDKATNQSFQASPAPHPPHQCSEVEGGGNTGVQVVLWVMWFGSNITTTKRHKKVQVMKITLHYQV